MSVPQGRHGYVSFNNSIFAGAKLIPVFSWAMPNPDNLQTPLPVGNSFITNHGEGLKTTQFTCAFDVRVEATEVLSMNFWNSFQSRTFSSGFDDTVGSTIIASDGRALWTLDNAKFESFILTVSKGAQIGLQAVFVAPGVPTPSSHVPAAYAPVDAKAPLMFDAASFTGITGNCYGATITAANNHLPNGPLDGTKYLSSWDAGVISCGVEFTFDARVSSGNAPFAAGATIALVLAGDATRTFTMKKVTMNNPRDANANVGQSFIPRSCIVEGDSTPTKPLVVS